MKKIHIIFLGVILLTLTSCADYLDLHSHSSIPPEAVTEKDLPALRNGMYYSVQNGPGVYSFIVFDIVGGTLSTSTGNPRDLINQTLSPLHTIIANGWNGYYSALYDVNNLINAVEDFSSSPVRNMALGEAYYFRAYIYFCLVTRWGAVPILRENTMAKVSRNPVNEVWAFVEENLEKAAELLGASSSYYYTSADAVTALKARVMLSQGKMTEAANLAESLITSGNYRLDTFEKIFRKVSNSEIIFAFENLSEESSNNISDMFYTYAHPNKGNSTYRLPADMVSAFETTDKRRDISVENQGGIDCVNKYPSGQSGKDPVIISRIAEMYLISAEAQGRLNGIGRLNELRNFRGLSSVNPTSDDDFLNEILLERRRELLAENFMYHDLVRTGKAKEWLGLLDHQLLFPIPGKELQLNTNLEPNPGY